MCDILCPQEETDRIDKEAVKDIFFQFQVPLEPEMVELLLAVTSNAEAQSHYTDLVALMNWKFELPDQVLSRVLENCQKFDEHRTIVLKDGYRKSSDKIKAATGYLPTDGEILHIIHSHAPNKIHTGICTMIYTKGITN